MPERAILNWPPVHEEGSSESEGLRLGRLDWIALAVVALGGFVGLRKGLLASAARDHRHRRGRGDRARGSRRSC